MQPFEARDQLESEVNSLKRIVEDIYFSEDDVMDKEDMGNTMYVDLAKDLDTIRLKVQETITELRAVKKKYEVF